MCMQTKTHVPCEPYIEYTRQSRLKEQVNCETQATAKAGTRTLQRWQEPVPLEPRYASRLMNLQTTLV